MKKILVPVGFSECSLIALEYAFVLAKNINAQIHILHVIESNSFFNKIINVNYEEKNIIKNIQNELDILKTNGRLKHQLQIETCIKKGKVYEEIIKTSILINAEFIVIGKNGASGITEFTHIGSNTLKTIKHSTIPVITVKNEYEKTSIKNVLLPLDLTKKTTQKLSFAINFAKQFDAKLHIVSALITEISIIKEKLDQQLEIVKETIDNQKVLYTIELLNDIGEKNIITPILDYRKKIDADAVIIMTQPESVILKNYIGPAAQCFINNAEAPVICIAPK